MNDKLLVKGKQVCDDSWICGYPYSDGKKSYIAYEGKKDCVIHEVVPETVGKYTGLTDNNDKMIFEGDILQANGFLPINEYKFVVKFGKCGGVKNVDHEVGYIGFYVIPIGKDSELFIESGVRTDILYWLNAYKVSIIGNIHDNSELLNGVDISVSDDINQPVLQSATPENFELMNG